MARRDAREALKTLPSAEPVAIEVPYRFTPRPYQLPLVHAMQLGCKRAIAVWHRRTGKDLTIFAAVVVPQAVQRKGTYFYMFEDLPHGRKAIWDNQDKEGVPFRDRIPAALIASVNETELQITLTNGSIIQLVGADRADDLIGTNPVGIVYSEYATLKAPAPTAASPNPQPYGWDLMRPILAENGGWAIFNSTPRGRNHFYRLYQMARGNPAWFAQVLTADDTGIDPAIIQAERDAGMPEWLIRREYYCSFEAQAEGSYYGSLIEEAERAGRITRVPWEPTLTVDTWWDLGVDTMAVWCVQRLGRELRVIDYLEGMGAGVAAYCRVLKEGKPYTYGTHVGPHDLEVRDIGSGESRHDIARRLGVRFQIAPKLKVQEGIDAVFRLLPRCYFDAGPEVAKGIEHLRQYTKKYNRTLGQYMDEPEHDSHSHAADAFRMGAVVEPRARSVTESHQRYAISGGFGWDAARDRQRRARSGMSAW